MKTARKPGKQSALSQSDLALWAAYSQTLTRLMPGRKRLAVAPEAPPYVAPSAPTAPAPPRRSFTPGPVELDLTPSGLDKSTWKKFSTGKMRAMRRLDLHGHTAGRAHHAVRDFIEQAHAEGARCIEIITGNGEILARELPHWLNAPSLRPLILAIAHPHAANTGSVRILLRRIRA